ncbi:MAG: hypothetical protein HY327_00145 [Chloroflexi bacterium]|nr:hypothetical protein [Chloroflexota bacterium]
MRDLTPPLLWRGLARLKRESKLPLLRGKAQAEWEYIPEGWDYALTHQVKGWNVAEILEVYKRKWSRFAAMAAGPTPLGIAHESEMVTNEDVSNQNTILAFGYAIALAAHKSDTLSMLDWGGGIGHYYLFARTLLPDVRIEYHCKDMPLLTEYGARLFPEQRFYADDSCLTRTFDFVMASTSLHYAEDWQRLLEKLARATRGYLFITQLPTVLQSPSFVFIQRPYNYGYNTEYLGWCLNRSAFLDQASHSDLELVREFVIGARPFIVNAPEQCQYRGFLFRPRK